MDRSAIIHKAFTGVFIGLLALYGCSGDTAGPSGDTTADTRGFTECVNCHSDAAKPSGLSNVVGESAESKVAEEGWLNGPHSNNESIDAYHNHIDLGPMNEGFPYFGYSGLGVDPACTTKCHDQLGDGRLISEYAAQTGVDTFGKIDRPVIGCESCHGSGANHFGIGPIANAEPGPGKCGQCHNAEFDHNLYHPEGDNIYEDYRASVHNSSINSHNYVGNIPPDVKGTCSKCHTDEGAKLYKDVKGGHDELAAALALAPAVENASQVQCRTCHDAHNPHKLLHDATKDALGNIASSDEFNTCTNCHQTGDAYHGEKNGHSWGPQVTNSPSVGIGNFDSIEIIYDTHFDNATTPWIEGYVLDRTSDRVCRDCHNPHSANTAINRQWAMSAHGGFILESKELAFANATDDTAEVDEILYGTVSSFGDVTEDGIYNAPAWVHYDFKSRSGGACRRCHTSTGFKKLASDPVNYNPSGPADSFGFAATGEQREMLYCWACHSSNAGDLRDSFKTGPAPTDVQPLYFQNTAPYAEPAGRIASVPDLKGSNICVSCHSGRESGGVIKAASPAIYNNTSFKNSHYLAAGGTLFRTAGYEYYADPSYDNGGLAFLHDSIGLGTDGNGPCVGCHMRSDEGHTLEAVKRDPSGDIIDIPSYEKTCSECHLGEQALVDRLNTLKAGYDAALAELMTALAGTGLNFYPKHPYFYNAAYDPAYSETGLCSKNLPVKNWQTGGTSTYAWSGTSCVSSVATPGTEGTGPDNMGAAFNYNLLKHEPGAYVHNGLYARRLIYDSIDWLDGTMDGLISVSGPAQEYLGMSRP